MNCPGELAVDALDRVFNETNPSFLVLSLAKLRKPESWNMTVQQPQSKAKRKASINHPSVLASTFGVYCKCCDGPYLAAVASAFA